MVSNEFTTTTSTVVIRFATRDQIGHLEACAESFAKRGLHFGLLT